MASHKGYDREFYTLDGLAMKTGRSLNIAKGQFAVVDMESTQNQRGLSVISSFAGLPKSRKLEMRMGVAPIGVNRSQSNKAMATQIFKISDVVGLRVDAPKTKEAVGDHLRIGFDGLDITTAIKLQNGDNESIEIVLTGQAIGMLGYTNAQATVNLYLEAPNTGAFTDQEIVERAISTFNDLKLMGNVPITNYVKAKAVNSLAVAAVGTASTFFKLILTDDGNYSALAKVQAQYPDFQVKLEGSLGGVSTYVLLASAVTVLPAYVITTTSTIPDCDVCPEGYTLVEGLCTSIETSSYAWTPGESCTSSTEAYTITLADPDCGDNRLADLQAAFPELTIVVGTTAGCLTSFTTTVETNVVCEDCSTIITELYESITPGDFEQISWTKTPKVYNAAALMGIDFKATIQKFLGDEQFKDNMPAVFSSVRLNVAGGLPFVNESFSKGRKNRFNVKLLQRAQEPENYGFNFLDWENRSNRYFTGRQRFEGNNYGNLVLGLESHTKPGVQYVDYILDVRSTRFAQGFSGEVTENFHYHVFAEVGKHKDVEDILNALAASVGVETVQAYS
jgi:hypothetical protein